MIKVKREGIIIEPTDLEFENQAVLNPACIRVGDNVHMFYRAVRKGNYSTIGYCKLAGPLTVVKRAKKPILVPELDYEQHGLEDPRIVFIDGKYYLTYMAYDGENVVAAYAISKDLKKFKKKKPLTPLISYAEMRDLIAPKIRKKYSCFEKYNKRKNATEDEVFVWGKDVFLFPRRIRGKFALIHRVIPEIQVIYFKNFKELTKTFWKEHFKRLANYIVIETKYWFESRFIGGGCPPVLTDKGWLFIYHTIEDTQKGRIYRAAAALLNKNNPHKVIGRLDYPLFSPKEKWEKEGVVGNVVFPTGTAVFGEKLYIYYGAADKQIAAVSLNINELLDELVKKGNLK